MFGLPGASAVAFPGLTWGGGGGVQTLNVEHMRMRVVHGMISLSRHKLRTGEMLHVQTLFLLDKNQSQQTKETTRAFPSGYVVFQ